MGRRSLTVLSTIVMLEQLSRAFTVLLQFFFKSFNSFFTNEKFLKVQFSRACTVLLYLSFKSSSSFYTNRKIFSLAFLQAEDPPSTIFQQKIFIEKKTELELFFTGPRKFSSFLWTYQFKHISFSHQVKAPFDRIAQSL